ncbi:MAG TPA: adenosine deaminase [Candidatus Tumulicola sp.]|nr:adenosine deaminase [Candidatus Tumulicola sp.]
MPAANGPEARPPKSAAMDQADAPLAARIPKIHLHCHLEGSLRAQTFVDLAGRYGVPLRYRPGADAQAEPLETGDPTDPYRFADFQEFLYAFAAVNRALRRADDYARLAREFVADALAQNVVYGELFISPSVWTFFHPELDVREAVAAIAGELRAARPRAEFALIVDLTRNFGAENGMRTAQLAASLTDLGVVGIGLGGDEVRFPPDQFVAAFAWAKAAGLQTVAHAGEAAGAQNVRDAVERLGAQRIGHGIAALDDPETLELLARNRVALEVCPTSNAVTGVARTGEPAFVQLDRAGCVVTIDADDPAMFGTSIAREYALVERMAGPQTLARFVANAIDASFAGDGVKAELRALLAAELDPARRSGIEHVGP